MSVASESFPVVIEKAVYDFSWTKSTWYVAEVDCDGGRQVVCPNEGQYPHGSGLWCGVVSVIDGVGQVTVECWKVVERQVAPVVVVVEG